jgi:YD repeat-containing protein
VYNGDGQLVSIDFDYNTGADRTYTYDSDSGYLTDLVDDDTDMDYAYSNLGRLTSITDNEYGTPKTISYTYYANGLRETSIARHSRVYSSIIARNRKGFPSRVRSHAMS